MPKTPRDIANSAYTYLNTVAAPGQVISDVRLEEIKPDSKSANWIVVLSYDVIGQYIFDKRREYKEFIVNPEAEVISMSIKIIK